MSAGRCWPPQATSLAEGMALATSTSKKASRRALWRLVLPFFSQHTRWSPKGSTASPHSGQPGKVCPMGRMGKPNHHRKRRR